MGLCSRHCPGQYRGSRSVSEAETWDPAAGTSPTAPNPVPDWGRSRRDRVPKSCSREKPPHPPLPPTPSDGSGVVPKSEVSPPAAVVLKPSASIVAGAAQAQARPGRETLTALLKAVVRLPPCFAPSFSPKWIFRLLVLLPPCRTAPKHNHSTKNTAKNQEGKRGF